MNQGVLPVAYQRVMGAAECCSVLQQGDALQHIVTHFNTHGSFQMNQAVISVAYERVMGAAVCCSVLQRVAVFGSVLQCVVACCFARMTLPCRML